MSSQRRIDSSRANGAKSRGPVTPEGRARSRAARLTNGLTSGVVVLSYESEEEFNALREEYLADYQPQTRSRFDLVGQLVATRWRLDRVISLQSALMEIQTTRQQREIDKEFQSCGGESAPPSPTSISATIPTPSKASTATKPASAPSSAGPSSSWTPSSKIKNCMMNPIPHNPRILMRMGTTPKPHHRPSTIHHRPPRSRSAPMRSGSCAASSFVAATIIGLAAIVRRSAASEIQALPGLIR